MDTIQISAKNLGQTALEDFCPRCYWIRLKVKNLPWQSFPGIFSSIDSYTKACVHEMIDRRYGNDDKSLLPEWMQQIGDIVSYEKVPHHSKCRYTDQKSGIVLTGMLDDIWLRVDGSRVIVDFKTAKFTENQDKLFPLYEIQSVVYSILIDPKADLYLIYFEPDTDKESACDNIIDKGFSMCFHAVVVPVVNDKSKVRQALSRTREIYEMSAAPEGRVGCKDCQNLDLVMSSLWQGKNKELFQKNT